jgi:hypothetical protein
MASFLFFSTNFGGQGPWLMMMALLGSSIHEEGSVRKQARVAITPRTINPIS